MHIFHSLEVICDSSVFAFLYERMRIRPEIPLKTQKQRGNVSNLIVTAHSTESLINLTMAYVHMLHVYNVLRRNDLHYR